MALFAATQPAVSCRGIHLDLKGLPPNSKRLVDLLELLAACRVNLVLVEWEDTFPWRKFPELRCETAYSEETVRRFAQRAAELSIEVVPLVQSFGHMETVLSKERFTHLRELPDSPADLCPSKPDARDVIGAMIDDVLEMGGGIKRFHLGGDEVWSLGTCEACRPAAERSGKAALYLQHIEPLLDLLASRGVRPILWDDMMRKWPEPELKRLSAKTDLMCWSYRAEPFSRVTHEILDRYAAAGVSVWGGSAFKGADGPQIDVCDPGVRAANLAAWAREGARRAMTGLVATGWSRYNTFAAPCEGIEASLDVLVLAAASMWDGDLAEGALGEAETLLTSGEGLKALAGDRFARCRQLSRELKEWRGSLNALLGRAQGQAHVAGERDRRNDRSASQLKGRLEKHCARGEELGREWVEAHEGLVDPVWLQRYVDSRLWFARNVAPVVLAAL